MKKPCTVKRFDHTACVRSLNRLVTFFEKRLAAREASADVLDQSLIKSTRLDVKELRQLRRWVQLKRYVTATRYYLSLDSYLRDWVPNRVVSFVWDEGWKQYVTQYADGKAYAKRKRK